MWPSSLSLAILLAFALTAVESQCLSTTNALEQRESMVAQTDPTFQEPRTYILCPSTIFNIGNLDADNKPVNGQDFIRARPNLHLKCGDDGKVENNCFVTGGDIQVDGTSFLGNTVETIKNVTMEGITFTSAKKYAVWATKQGEITFIDCAFTDIVDAIAPVYLDFYDADNLRTELAVSFFGCTFKNNRFFGEGSNPAIVTANGEQHRLVLERNFFDTNDYIFNNTKFEKNSFLVETSGPLSLSRNCFYNNLVGVSPVASYGLEVQSFDNFGTNSQGRTCQFLSSFETSAQFVSFSPRCINFESVSECTATYTDSPSLAPSFVPSVSPSLFPSVSPTRVPSKSPSFNPTKIGDTYSPTTKFAPSASPSASPSTVASSSPSSHSSSNPSSNPSTAPYPSTSDTHDIGVSVLTSVLIVVLAMLPP